MANATSGALVIKSRWSPNNSRTGQPRRRASSASSKYPSLRRTYPLWTAGHFQTGGIDSQKYLSGTLGSSISMSSRVTESGMSDAITPDPNHSDHGGKTPSSAIAVNRFKNASGINGVSVDIAGKPASTKTIEAPRVLDRSTIVGRRGPAPLCATKIALSSPVIWATTSSTTPCQPRSVAGGLMIKIATS